MQDAYITLEEAAAFEGIKYNTLVQRMKRAPNQYDTKTQAREGGGSINMLYLGVAGRLFKGFSIGANISYMFGTIYNDTYAYTSTGSTSLLERQIDVRDFHLDFGAQYNFDIARNTFTLGLTYSPGKKLLGHYREYFYDPHG